MLSVHLFGRSNWVQCIQNFSPNYKMYLVINEKLFQWVVYYLIAVHYSAYNIYTNEDISLKLVNVNYR